MSGVTISGVEKWFLRRGGEKLQVLDGVSFDVPAGSSVAVVGASGSGKSTLLNIIAGLIPADAGRVTIGDGQGAETPTMTYMFQEDRLLPWRTAAGNVRFGVETRPMPAAERDRRVRDTLALVGLQDFADAYPHELSGGMRSRVALARSLVSEPRILLMDEPFSKLDPKTRSQMHAEVVRIAAERQVTVIFVTHDVEEAVVLADRVVVLKPRPGRVQQIVPVALPHPRDPISVEVAETVRELRRAI